MRLLLILAIRYYTTISFTLLPYIQIDYAHYFRLAQCHAKCAQKYGVPSTRYLLDGSIEEYLDVKNSASQECESGCHQHRRLHGRGPRGPSKGPLDDGLRFWPESTANIAKAGSTLVSSVRLLCQNPTVDEEFGDTSEGFVSISTLRPAGTTRFIIQWKHRIPTLAVYEESQWITASIEKETLFKVKGLVPGVEYRFMVTAVGPNGRLGETVASPWVEISNSAIPRTPSGPVVLRNGYNSDKGVTVHVEWPQTSDDSCYYKIQLSNSTTEIKTEVILDSSASLLMPHLEFETQYSVGVTATSADRSQSSRTLSANFKSLQCKDVHGQGSLQCAPEPVSNLAVLVHPNGTAVISWKPSAEQENILFYQLISNALSTESGCRTRHETINLRATATSAIIYLPSQKCEYAVRLVNYDLIGRDAVAEIRVLTESPSSPGIRFEAVLRPELLLAAVALFLMFPLCILIHCLRRRRQTASEKLQKPTIYV